MTKTSGPLAAFDDVIGRARTAEDAYRALYELTRDTIGVKLFTVMTIDIEAGLARRAYTNDPEAYPTSGTKPIHRDEWFGQMEEGRAPYLATSIPAVRDQFPDHELIASLGCGSVINLPVVLGDRLIATINLLDAEGVYVEDHADRAEAELSVPAKLACLVAMQD